MVVVASKEDPLAVGKDLGLASKGQLRLRRLQ